MATPTPLRAGRATRTHVPEPAPRVLIADAYPPTRLGLRITLETAGFDIAGEASSAAAAVEVAVAEEPDVCLVDVSLPGGGVAATRAICAELPGTAVVMLAASAVADDLLRAIRAGASGYLLKGMDVERLPTALRTVLDGEPAIPRSLVGALVKQIQHGERPRPLPVVHGRRISLTPREAEVLDLMRHELPTRAIALRLGISEVTVRRHASAVMRKLDVRDRQAAVGLVGLRGGADAQARRATA